jgi:hypothetical protein
MILRQNIKRAKAVHPHLFLPPSRGKMRKGDRKGSSDFDGSTDRIFKDNAKDTKVPNFGVKNPFREDFTLP